MRAGYCAEIAAKWSGIRHAAWKTFNNNNNTKFIWRHYAPIDALA